MLCDVLFYEDLEALTRHERDNATFVDLCDQDIDSLQIYYFPKFVW